MTPFGLTVLLQLPLLLPGVMPALVVIGANRGTGANGGDVIRCDSSAVAAWCCLLPRVDGATGPGGAWQWPYLV